MQAIEAPFPPSTRRFFTTLRQIQGWCLSAAEKGAKVFLVAPRPYLGEDMCATSRLWRDEGEVPTTDLARAIFSNVASAQTMQTPKIGKGLPFSYTASLPSAKLHADTKMPSLLTDGRHGSAATESVQYDGDVSIIADLGQPTELSKVRLLAYQREDFEVMTVKVSASMDKTSWTGATTVSNPNPGQQSFTRLVVGGTPRPEAKPLGISFVTKEKKVKSYPIYEYTLELPMRDGSWASFAKADQLARDMTWQEGQAEAAEILFQVPPIR